MKRLDYVLRDWRFRVVMPYISDGCSILDIGGYDGALLERLQGIERGVCIDPLIEEKKDRKLEFIRHRITDTIPLPDESFDVITLLAVYEHLSSPKESFTAELYRVLRNDGTVLLTVPSRFVDNILKVLIRLRLIDGMSFEEHGHFDSAEMVDIFRACGFILRRWVKFQLGLNNLFVFQKEGGMKRHFGTG
jgi:SAM-dependent methyltransferase